MAIVAALMRPSAAQDYCSLVVEVVSPAGSPVSGITVQVDEQGGNFDRAVTTLGEVRFCELGFGVVSVTAAPFACGQTTVSAVHLAWRQTRTLKLVYNGAFGCEDSLPLLACQLLLRFSDGGGKWLKGVQVTSEPPAKWEASDAGGRTLVTARPNTELMLRAELQGFEPEVIPVQCSASAIKAEKFIQMRRSR